MSKFEKINKWLYKGVVIYISTLIIFYLVSEQYLIMLIESIILAIFIYFTYGITKKIEEVNILYNYYDVYETIPQKISVSQIRKFSLTSLDRIKIKREAIEQYVLAGTDEDKNHYSDIINFLEDNEMSPIVITYKKGQ